MECKKKFLEYCQELARNTGEYSPRDSLAESSENKAVQLRDIVEDPKRLSLICYKSSAHSKEETTERIKKLIQLNQERTLSSRYIGALLPDTEVVADLGDGIHLLLSHTQLFAVVNKDGRVWFSSEHS